MLHAPSTIKTKETHPHHPSHPVSSTSVSCAPPLVSASIVPAASRLGPHQPPTHHQPQHYIHIVSPARNCAKLQSSWPILPDLLSCLCSPSPSPTPNRPSVADLTHNP